MRVKIISATGTGSEAIKDKIGKEFDVIDGKKSPNGWYWIYEGLMYDLGVHERDCIVIDDDPTPIRNSENSEWIY